MIVSLWKRIFKKRKSKDSELTAFHLQEYDIIVMIGIKDSRLICKFEKSEDYTDEEVRAEVERNIKEILKGDYNANI